MHFYNQKSWWLSITNLNELIIVGVATLNESSGKVMYGFTSKTHSYGSPFFYFPQRH